MCIFATKIQKKIHICKYFIKYFTFVTNNLFFYVIFRIFASEKVER